VKVRSDYYSSSARGLSLSGLVLFAIYGSIVFGSLFPIQLMVPAWQLKAGSALINASPFPLIGLCLLHLAIDINPKDELLIKRHSFAAKLAVAVSLGFLLLVPLMSMAAVVQQQQRATDQSSLIRRAETNLQALSQVVSSSKTTSELRDRLIALNGPVIDEDNATKPLSTLKAEVNGLLTQAAAQVARKRQQLPPSKPWRLFPELLRNSFACLALAIGFAGLARRGRRTIPLLAELQLGWERLKFQKLRIRRGPRPGDADPGYLHELIEQAKAEKDPPSRPQR